MKSYRRKLLDKKILPKTKTGLLFLPLLGKKASDYGDFLNDVYLTEDYTLVFSFEDNDNETLREMLWYLEAHHSHLKQDNDDGGREILFFQQFPKELKDVLPAFFKGEYSKMSKAYKDRIFKLYGEGTGNSVIGKNGLPQYTHADVLNKPVKKVKEFADALGIEVSEIKELLDSPEKEVELYKTTKQLQEIYGVK